MAQVRARHGSTGDLVRERVGRILPALPGLAVQAAELPALRRVDPMKAYPLAMHLNGIAVDHRCNAGHVGQGRVAISAGTSAMARTTASLMPADVQVV